MSERQVTMVRGQPTKFRTHAWLDTSKIATADEHPVKYGLQGFVPDHGWCHMAEGSKPIFYDKHEDAEAEVKRLRRERRARSRA